MGKAEAHVESYLVERVEALGGLCRKAAWIGRRGCPDRYVAIPGRDQFWVECKSAVGVLDGHQVREMCRLQDAGVRVYVVRSRADVDSLLTRGFV